MGCRLMGPSRTVEGADAGGKPARSLGASARASLLWGGGFTLFRDVVQFATMLILVRLLAPADYGRMALAQTIVGLLAVVSFGTLVTHALQARDPAEIDWQAHFTAAVVINSALALLTLGLAWLLSFTSRYSDAALPLAALSLVFIVEIPGALRHQMVQVAHDWQRFRLLLIAGSLLGAGAGIVIAMLGGGVWALVVQPVLFGLPAALDLVLFSKWWPDWSWSWPRYRETAGFGITRIGAGALLHGRRTIEQSLLAGSYDFAALGVFTRSIGLATLIAGRIGSVAIMSLYPVITRAEQRSAQFQRYAGLVLRGVVWATVPAAVFLALSAADIASLLYGPRWSAVIPLLPLAAAAVSFGGIASAVSSLLLANNEIKACLLIDVASAVLGVALALWLVPVGMEIYLAALAAHGLIVLGLTITVLGATGGIDRTAILSALLPAAVAGAAGAGAILSARAALGVSEIVVLRLGLEFALLSISYLAVLRLLFKTPLSELLEVAPGGVRLGAVLALTPRMI
jgi:O-antigen/teichoic acid export membrane protein